MAKFLVLLNFLLWLFEVDGDRVVSLVWGSLVVVGLVAFFAPFLVRVPALTWLSVSILDNLIASSRVSGFLPHTVSWICIGKPPMNLSIPRVMGVII